MNHEKRWAQCFDDIGGSNMVNKSGNFFHVNTPKKVSLLLLDGSRQEVTCRDPAGIYY